MLIEFLVVMDRMCKCKFWFIVIFEITTWEEYGTSS